MRFLRSNQAETVHSQRSKPYKWIVTFGFATVLAVLGMLALPTFAATPVQQLPNVVDFSSARFDVLITAKSQDEQQVLYGKGETIIPDKVRMGVTSDNLKRVVYVVMIGDTLYTNNGNGWIKSDSSLYSGVQLETVSEQFAFIQQYADGIINIGDTTVRGVPVTQYQVWVSGKRLLSLYRDDELSDDMRDIIEHVTYKYDFWIGKRDNVLYQQNLAISTPTFKINKQEVPATELSTLLTFYDFNNPGISIQAPTQ